MPKYATAIGRAALGDANAPTIEKQLPVVLDAEERRARADELVAKLDKLDDIDAKVQAAKEAAKQPRKDAEKRVRELRRQLRTGREVRAVACWEVRSYDTGLAEVIRTDTGEVVVSRPLTAEERQKTIPETFPGDDGRKPAPPSRPRSKG